MSKKNNKKISFFLKKRYILINGENVFSENQKKVDKKMDYIFSCFVENKKGYGELFGKVDPIEVLHLNINKRAFEMYCNKEKKMEYRPVNSFYGDKIKTIKFLKDFTEHDVVVVMHYKKFEVIGLVGKVELDFFDLLPQYMLDFYPNSLPDEVFYKVSFSKLYIRGRK